MNPYPASKGNNREPNRIADIVHLLVENGLMSEEHNTFIGHTTLVIGVLVAVLWLAWFILKG